VQVSSLPTQEIGFFSYNDKHEYLQDDSSIRYYYPPIIGANLSKGFDTFEKLNDSADDHLDSLLKTIIFNEKKTGIKTDAQVITWRGMLTKVYAVGVKKPLPFMLILI
jgi:RAT1-interacting protein